jgi:tripartite-type tricarboxylate transporter receptor subunit TctC
MRDPMEISSVRRRLLAAMAAGALAPRAALAAAAFPARTVRIVVPYSVGIGPDLVARALADWLAQRWGQPVIVDNKPGASGIVAFAEVRNTAPDGHTLFVGDTGTLAVNPLIHASLPYDPVRDLAPISLLFRATFLILVSAKSRYATLGEMLTDARREPGRVSYASLGNGHPTQMAVETMARAANASMLHVPFKEAGALFTAVALGDVDFTVFGFNSASGYLKGGKMKALAVAAPARLAEAPEVPTIVEAGGPPVEMRPWAALVGVAGTPSAVLMAIQRDVVQALAAPAVRGRIEAAGFEVTPSTPQQLTARIEGDVKLYTTLVREGRVRSD